MTSYEKTTGCYVGKKGVKCMICGCYYFKDKFDYQPYVCSDCHDFSLTVIEFE